uniref:Uncharacterized protein n=1 Tax=Caenorhabditis tropicalis TaxID=1561998 RepID=A0A1I7TEF8_9PELO
MKKQKKKKKMMMLGEQHKQLSVQDKAKKKTGKPDGTQRTGGGTTGGTTGSMTPGRPDTPNKGGDDDEDDVKFNINIKKADDKKDEFDDDEENPLAKIAVKTRGKNGQGKKAGGGHVGKGEKGKHKREETQNRPFLAPNEKQIGVSCYQFEPSLPEAGKPLHPPPPTPPPPAPLAASATVPAPALAPPPPLPPPSATIPAPHPPRKVPMQKSCEAGGRNANRTISTATTVTTVTTTTQVPTPAPNVPSTVGGNTKSTMSQITNNQPVNKRTKSNEQERTDKNLEKTQKDGENK